MARHILVVDDNGDVRDVIMLMLEASGFVATSASGGEVMRDILAADVSHIDAIVLDSVMPGEASASLALHAKALRIPVVMISGSHDSMKFAKDHGLQLLCKPFGIAELVQAVEDAIGSGEFGQRDA
jgi:two-component system, OmpR family, response regulator